MKYIDLQSINQDNIEYIIENKRLLQLNTKWIPEFWSLEAKAYFEEDPEGIRWRKMHDPQNTFAQLPPPKLSWQQIRNTFYISSYSKQCPDYFDIDSDLEGLMVACVSYNGFKLDCDCACEVGIHDDLVRLIAKDC